MAASVTTAGIELGGTKTIAVLAQGSRILARTEFPTRAPDETLSRARDQLAAWAANEPISAIGIASFGPIRLDRDAADFGRMLPTPKPGWTDADVAGTLTRELFCPWTIDTDVNGAALAEYRWGAGIGCDSLCYVTLGTGVGGGLLLDGKPVHGAMHPEIGHLRLRRTQSDEFSGVCPFHGDCIEGLISGPALAARFGMPSDQIPDTDPRWDLVADDLAELAAAILLVTSARRILFGGGIGLKRPFLLPLVRERVVDKLAGYLAHFDLSTAQQVLRQPQLGHDSGALGAIALAESCLHRR